jgi:hypothetical protein
MRKRKKARLFLTIGALVLLLVVLGLLLICIFEGEKPRITLQPSPEFISESQKFILTVSDMKRGLKTLKVSLNQEGRKISVLQKTFPFKGVLNQGGVNRYDTEFSIDPSKLNLAQGRVDLSVRVWDYSRRRGGDGNLSLVQHKMVVDTIPPAIRAISRMHYVNVGGTGLILYQTSSDSVESGLWVKDGGKDKPIEHFFQGFPVGEESQEGYHVCYFAIPVNTKPHPEVYLWAEDRAGNRSRASFYYQIRRKWFPTDRVNISDRFLKRVLPYFSFYSFAAEDSDISKFLKINKGLRQENALTFYTLGTKTSPTQLWKGTWLRLKNAANMAGFGDRRLYYYKGKKVDKQVHMGVDLASLANSEVPAANNGRVIFADHLGIYGIAVVLDHGQGLSSVYSHLSKMSVDPGQEVMKGDIIGITGQTGLAGGDHLHFGVMVSGVFVNAIEWWDSHWIQDNISRKLDLLKK